MAGIIPHVADAVYSGSARVAGVELSDADESLLGRAVAIVLQDPDAQILTSSVLEEVSYALENLCLPAGEIRRRAERALALSGLAGLEGRNPWTLSGGQRQRLAVACGVAAGASTLILDNPTAGMDREGAESVYRTLCSLAAGGTTVVCMESRPEALASVAGRIIVFDADGEMAVAPAAGLSQAPAVGAAKGARPAAGDSPPGQANLAGAANHAGGDSAPGAANPAGAGRWGGAPPRSMARLTARDVSVGAGRNPRLAAASLDLGAGSLHAIVGANGSGKTSLLSAITGAARLRSGGVEAFDDAGRRVTRFAQIACCFQNPENHFAHASVQAEFSAALRKASPAGPLSADERAGLLDELDLTEFVDVNPFALPSGGKHRLALALAMAGNRRFLVLDEPTAGQDRAGLNLIMNSLVKYRSRGGGVLVATHDLDLVAAHADTVTVLADGHVTDCGLPAEVFARPADPPAEVPAHPADPPAGSGTHPLTGLAAALVFVLGAALSPSAAARAPLFLVCCALLVGTAPRIGAALRQVALALAAALVFGLIALRSHFYTPEGIASPSPADLAEGSVKHGLLLGIVFAAAMAAGQLTSTRAVIESTIQLLRLPYRWGLAALSSMTLFTYLNQEFSLIRARVRLEEHGPKRFPAPGFRPLVVLARSAPPLFTAAIRLSSRMSMTMTTRAFGVFRSRTPRRHYRWRVRDTLAVFASCLAAAAAALLPRWIA
jgi:energy-coupling factor transporter ATP-binding protein EcfA2/energy-coupling factor transporter transmembrane protein EcfT